MTAMLASITALSISVWIHVTAALVGFGATFAESLTFPLAIKYGKQHLPYVHRLGIAINQRLANPALLIIIITGIYQTAKNWEFSDFWISATFLIALILGGLNGAYFVPGEKKLLAQVEQELAETGQPSADYRRKARQMGMVGALAGLLVLLAIFFMVTKPGA